MSLWKHYDTLPEETVLLQSLLDGIPDGVVVFDAAGKFMFWNLAAEKILKRAPANLPLEGWPRNFGFYRSDRFTPFPVEELPPVRALAGESSDDVEVYLKNGSLPAGAWLRVSARPLAIPPIFEGAIMVLREVTAEKRAQQALAAAHFELEKSEEKFRTLLTNLSGAIYRSEPGLDRRLRFVTPAIRAITGREASDFTSGNVVLSELVEAADLADVQAALFASFQEGRPYAMEYRVKLADGSVRWVSDRGRPVFGENGEPLWLDGILFDVTDRKEAEGSLLDRTAELARANAEREQLELFAYIVSHDLRSPLQKIMGFSELLRPSFGADDAKREDYSKRIQQTVERMSGLIDDILKFTKAATAREEAQAVDLDAVMKGVLTDLELRIQQSGGAVEVAPLPSVKGDRAQLGQVFFNLVGNALKYSKKGVPPRVRVSARTEGAEAVIDVSDNGIGFDPQGAEKMFKPFQRLHHGEYEGNGIGLAICQKIVTRFGGTLSATSVPGEGSVFTVRLAKA